ncbi:MAG: hypothetical protein UW95_C0002G0033 [Parcubacteria group bacterium GW2011_GWC1_45_14]|nr:MAG: hypothetical protein UW87_C0005G0014 [Candidatus Moranbacteria bacterium GW2011_GWC2_45_10]KKT95290.1 MAG: hypothetical protein UW95_C0002G0033 [Parcubacteria group bacterium GW2011_GWC1_45_14]
MEYGLLKVPHKAEQKISHISMARCATNLHNALVKFFGTPEHHERRRQNLQNRICALMEKLGKENLPGFYPMSRFDAHLQKQRVILARRMMAIGSAEEKYLELQEQAKKIERVLLLLEKSEAAH